MKPPVKNMRQMILEILSDKTLTARAIIEAVEKDKNHACAPNGVNAMLTILCREGLIRRKRKLCHCCKRTTSVYRKVNS